MSKAVSENATPKYNDRGLFLWIRYISIRYKLKRSILIPQLLILLIGQISKLKRVLILLWSTVSSLVLPPIIQQKRGCKNNGDGVDGDDCDFSGQVLRCILVAEGYKLCVSPQVALKHR